MGGESSETRGSAASRVDWVDAAKGVGILLVVAGHVWTRGSLRDAIYAFHMPLFFLLSGYMVRPQPMWPLLMRQIRSLLVPFAIFSCVLVSADLLIEGARGVRPIFPDLRAGLGAIVAHTEGLRGPFTILWFVPCLFLARIVWNMLARVMPDPVDWRWAVAMAAAVAAGHWAATASLSLPFGLRAVPGALLLLWVGQLWRARPPGAWRVALFLVPVALATVIWLPPVNMKIGDVGTPVLSLAGAVAISILLCRLVAALPRAAMGAAARLGRASLIIMYLHVAFIHFGAPYAPKWTLFIVALAGPLLVHALASATRPGRMLLLGER